MKTKDIKQSVLLNATPKQVYDSLMDSKKHSAFTGSVCKIGKKEGSAYTAYDGYINGKNLKLIPGELIIQTWQPIDGVWPEGYYSEVIFEMKENKNGTLLKFKHKGVPVGQYEEFKQGWIDNYWEPMNSFFSK